MREGVRSVRFAARVIAVAAVAMIGGCAYPVVQTVVSAPIAKAPGDSTPGPMPMVEIRTHNISPVLSVIAWDSDEVAYGLQGVLPRNGQAMPEGSRLTDHRLYIAADAIVEAYGPRRATLDSRELRVSGLQAEQKPCDGGNCLPARTYSVYIPDAMLREPRDTVIVRIYTRTDRELEFVLRGELVQGYLRTVDSVATALRSNALKTK